MRNEKSQLKLFLLVSSALFAPHIVVAQSAEQPAATPAAADAEPVSTLDEIIVTGTTSRNRTRLESSVDATLATAEDVQIKAPRSVADILEVVPGIFVEGTAGPVSNNYSVRGLQGGGQAFIQLQDDGLPVVYGGGLADRFYKNDLNLDRVEAVRGGSSGVLTVNGAAATINFISKKPNFDEGEGIVRLTGASFDQKRADLYYSAPLAKNIAFSLGGYFESTRGVRRSEFDYSSYHIRGALSKRWDDGGYVTLILKAGNDRSPYTATYPYQVGADGRTPTSIPGFNVLTDNIGGTSHANVEVPVSTFVERDGLRTFNLARGVRTVYKQVGIDFRKSVTSAIDVYTKARYLDFQYDFNGLFPGSNTGNGGLTSAVNYLDPARSPLAGFLAQGLAAFPGTTQFGLKDLRTGQLIPASDVASLNAINGNGLIQQTTLNHDNLRGREFGMDAGARYELTADIFTNSLTVGFQYFNNATDQNQSATAQQINDVRNDAHAYDIVALNAAGQTVGTLTDNGLVNYGNWGAGIRNNRISSFSAYLNDELKIGENLHVDAGVRWESETGRIFNGNTAAVNQPVRAGIGGITRDVGSTFDGTFTLTRANYSKAAWTVGANYVILRNLSAYARVADGFQTYGCDGGGCRRPASIRLYEVGARFQGYGLASSLTLFRTQFKNQSYGFIDPSDQTRTGGFTADLATNGLEVDMSYKPPIPWFRIDGFAVFQNPKLNNAVITGVSGSGPQPQLSGNSPERTPKTLVTITPKILLPRDYGEIYLRWKHVGRIYADPGNGLALPSYDVLSAGASFDITRSINFRIDVDNLTNEIGLTEGNPRAGLTQTISGGYFYGRGIVGRNGTASLTYKF